MKSANSIGVAIVASLVFAPFLLSGESASADSENLGLLPFDAMKHDVESCIESENFRNEPTSCARVSFSTCMKDWDVPDSRLKEGNCNHHEYQIWREQYQVLVLKLLDRAQRTDRDAAADRNPNIDAFSQVMAKEVQWQQLRESECRYAMSLTMGGTAGGSIYSVCLAELTAQRIAFLNARRKK